MSVRTLLFASVCVAAVACKPPPPGGYLAHVDDKPSGSALPPPPPPPPPPRPEVTWSEQCHKPIDTAKAGIAKILAVPGVRNVENTLVPFNEVSYSLDNAAEWARVIGDLHPDATIREAAHTCAKDVHQFVATLMLDLRVYTAIKSVDISAADAPTRRLVATILRDFRRSGVELDDKGRARLAEIDDTIAKLGRDFDQNVSLDVRTVEVKDPAKLAGMPADWLAAHKPDASGAIKLTADGADYYAVMRDAVDDDLRKQLYVAFRSKGDAKNESVIQQVLVLRAEKALLLGYKDWVDFESDDKMLHGGKAISDFIDRVQAAVMRRAKKDYAELLAQARKTNKAATEVGEWQRAYLENQVRLEKYNVDPTEVHKYFEADKVVAGMLDLVATLYDIKLVPVANDPRVWSPDVKVLDVMRGADRVGRMFLDLSPRPGKVRRTASYGLVDGVVGIQLPEAVLAASLPANLAHGDVVTLFHELGHVLHHLFGRATWVRQSGMATEPDFVDAPAMAFEELAWNPEVLAKFSTIPADVLDKLRHADALGRGSWAAQQLVYTAIALRMHQDSPSKLDQLGLVKQLQKKYSPFAYVDGTKPHASFSHLMSYSSNYYTYLWTRVVARELLSAYDKKSLLAADVAGAFRDKVFGAGGTKDATEIVKDFLGHPYTVKAFEKYLAE